MAKKAPSAAVVKSVTAAVVVPPVVEPVAAPTRGPKKFSSDTYLAEYKAEVASGGTWESLCQRTGFKLENVRQCVTMERSAIREILTEKVEATDDKFKKLIIEKYKSLEEYIAAKVEEQIPYMNESGTRNTSTAKRRNAVREIELSL